MLSLTHLIVLRDFPSARAQIWYALSASVMVSMSISSVWKFTLWGW
jgi:hypothetical protein